MLIRATIIVIALTFSFLHTKLSNIDNDRVTLVLVFDNFFTIKLTPKWKINLGIFSLSMNFVQFEKRI